ncbi:MAG: PspC domain-containing protein [Bacteroidota bacterium]
MEVENVHSFDYTEFIESNPIDGETDLDFVREEAPAQFKKDNRAFTIAGVVSLVAGTALFVGSMLPAGIKAEFANFVPIALGAGVVGLGFGMLKAFRKIFRRGNLNLPSLQVRRKIETRPRPEVQPIETYRPGKKLTKSRTDSVILGVCGGLAKHSGLSASTIRLLFIAAFAFSMGSAAFLYGILGAYLPAEEPEVEISDSNRKKRGKKRRALRR